MTMAHNVLNIKNASVKLALGAGVFTEYADAIDNAALNNTNASSQWIPVSGVVQQVEGALVWEVVLNLGQDLKTGSLYLFLLNNHGATGKIEFFPAGGATTPKVAANVTFSAPRALGGGVGIATAQATLRVDGQPTITPAP
jgi:hypothetical protein